MVWYGLPTELTFSMGKENLAVEFSIFLMNNWNNNTNDHAAVWCSTVTIMHLLYKTIHSPLYYHVLSTGGDPGDTDNLNYLPCQIFYYIKELILIIHS